jgi:hypothetical protein
MNETPKTPTPLPSSPPPLALAEKVVELEQIEPEFIALPSGKELNEAGAASLAASRPVRLVTMAGPVGCGKTTLLTSLYDLFQEKPISGYQFAGCNTLPAFELACHLSRTASDNAVADTQRTSYKEGDAQYLHLRIRPGNAQGEPLDMLFTDLSGEAFERACNSTSDCERLIFLRCTEHFVLLLDGKKLVHENKWWAVIEEGATVLQSCLDSGMIGSHTFVNVLWSKVDWFEGNNGHLKTLREQVQTDFEKRFSHRLGAFKFAEIAARPKPRSNLVFGHGLPDLLKYWAESSPRKRTMNLSPVKEGGTRESELFASRHFARVGGQNE